MRRFLVLIMLAAIVLPLSTRAQEETFDVGQVVIVDVASKPIRTQPSSTSGIATTVVQGDELTILSDSPIEAEGYVWWNIQFAEGDATGWLPDTAFSAQGSAATATESPSDATCWTDDQFTQVDGNPNWSAPPAIVIDPEEKYFATISTTKGEIVVELNSELAPIASNNFYCLATAGYYDGTDFHRISENYLIQGGDPTGTGTGTPGYAVPSDPTTGTYTAGSIALANRTPDQNGAQFFIAASDLTGQIPDQYPVFGQVMSGMEIVTEISSGPVEPNPRGELSSPLYPTTIVSIVVGVVEDEIGPPLQPQTPSPDIEPTVAVAPTVAIPPTTTMVIELEAKDIAFDSNELTISAAELPATIRMENTGAAQHDFVIDSLDIEVSAEPGETVEIVVPAGAAPGEYEFYCSIPGHREAGMVGTLTITGNGEPATAGTTEAGVGCAGLKTYQNDYDSVVLTTFFSNPDAVAIFERDEIAGEDWVDLLTDAELAAFETLFRDLAREVGTVEPPSYAAEWHALQIESFELFAQMFADSQVVGATLAEINHLSEMTRLENEVLQSLEFPGLCTEFVLWATEESVLL